MKNLVFILINFLSLALIAERGTCSDSMKTNPNSVILKNLLVKEANNNILAISSEMEKVLSEFKIKRDDFKTEKAFLRYIFHTISSKYLKSYENYSTLNETLHSGKYNCVSGSLLFSYIFKNLNIDCSIYETNFHVYLIAHVNGKDILIESTDPSYGFIANSKTIKNKINQYINKNKVDNNSSLNLYNKIDLLQLASLQYYNLAALSFNNKNFSDAIRYTKQSLMLYNNPRSKALLKLSSQQAKEYKISVKNSPTNEKGIIASLD